MNALGVAAQRASRTPRKDIRLNLRRVLAAGQRSTREQRWGVAVACAVAARNPQLREAVLEDARARSDPTVIEDARRPPR